jgi:hypothetical protein
MHYASDTRNYRNFGSNVKDWGHSLYCGMQSSVRGGGMLLYLVTLYAPPPLPQPSSDYRSSSSVLREAN